MKKQVFFLSVLLMCSGFCMAQDWILKVSSKVELRSWTLGTTAVRSEKILPGASITLYMENSIVSQTVSDFDGNFSVLVPANGEYILAISYAGCNTKKISINTKGTPKEVQENKLKNAVSLEGFVMAKPINGIDYSPLEQTLAKIYYDAQERGFKDNKSYTISGLNTVAKILEAEEARINIFCENNRSGDDALAKNDCVLAQKFYNNALNLFPGEKYPTQQLDKTASCILAKQEAEKLAEEKRARIELEEKYLQSVKEGDTGFNKKDWENAKLAYKEALSIRPNEPYPIMKLAEIDKMLAEADERTSAAISKTKYEAALKTADVFYSKKLWAEAEDAYYEALSYQQNEKYPKDQILAINKILSKENAGNDKKFREAIEKTAKLNDVKYAQAIKKIYDDALSYESDATYLKRKAEDAIAQKNAEREKALREKYPMGLTEEIINGNGVVIVKRILVKESEVWVYQKKIFNWGGVVCFRDDTSITEGIFDFETKL